MTSAPQGRADVERNRAAIIKAATLVLAARPHASMHDIAEAAGVNRATLYRHFQNRDALIAALHHAALADTAELAGRIPTTGPVLPALGDYLSQAIGLGERYRFLSIAPRTDSAMFHAEGRAALPVIAAVTRGQERGEIDSRFDPAFAAGLMVMHVIGAVGMVQREQMHLDTAIAQARLALTKALEAQPQQPGPVPLTGIELST